MTKKEETEFKTLRWELRELQSEIEFVAASLFNRTSELVGKDDKLANQRTQLRMYQEKLALMKTPRGICRTIGQYLGICR